MLRGGTRVEGESLLEVTHCSFALLQQFEDTNACRVPEDTEELTLERVDRMVGGSQRRPFIAGKECRMQYGRFSNKFLSS